MDGATGSIRWVSAVQRTEDALPLDDGITIRFEAPVNLKGHGAKRTRDALVQRQIGPCVGRCASHVNTRIKRDSSHGCADALHLERLVHARGIPNDTIRCAVCNRHALVEDGRDREVKKNRKLGGEDRRIMRFEGPIAKKLDRATPGRPPASTRARLPWIVKDRLKTLHERALQMPLLPGISSVLRCWVMDQEMTTRANRKHLLERAPIHRRMIYRRDDQRILAITRAGRLEKGTDRRKGEDQVALDAFQETCEQG